MVLTMPTHERDFANHLKIIADECGWDETIKEAAVMRFIATRDNSDILFDEFKDFLSEQRFNENELLGITDDDDEDEEDDEEEFDDEDDLDEEDDFEDDDDLDEDLDEDEEDDDEDED